MDLQHLSNLFGTTYSHDPNVRRAGELEIRKLATQEGVVPAVMEIISSDKVEMPTRQAATLWLKNRVHKAGRIADLTKLSAQERATIEADTNVLKASILRLLIASPSRVISVQLAATLKDLVANDFPSKWPNLLNDIKTLLGGGDPRELHAGCLALLEVVRAFRFRQKEDILPAIIAETFPAIVQIATQLLQNPPTTADETVPSILHLIVKTYKTSIILNLSKHQQSPESLVPWGQLFFQIVNLQLPPQAVPEDADDREKCEWWKAKKWAYSTLGRLFSRFGNPSQLPSPMKPQYEEFANHFVSAFAPEIFKTYFQQVQLYVQGQTWLSRKSQYLIFQFFTECVKPKSTWAIVKPHFEYLVMNFVYPQLCFTAEKQEIWETDPIDYTRVSIDEYENYTTPAASATSFLLALAGSRTKIAFMPILTIINNVLASNAPSQQKFGALNMTCALGPFIMRHPDVRPNMEQFLVTHVLPEFSSSHGYMRAIACEVLSTVEKNGIIWAKADNLTTHSRALATALDDADLPVRVHAALALTDMISAQESVRVAVAPQVGKVVGDLLKLSDETDLDILNSAMETIVESFPDELLPVAAQLTSRLCDSYMRLVAEVVTQDESSTVDLESAMTAGSEDEDKTFAAMGTCKTISSIVDAVEGNTDILMQVHEIVMPIILYTLDKKILDLFDNIYDIADSLTYKLHRVLPSMWPVFEMTYNLFKADAVDFLDEMLPFLENCISLDPDTFRARADYRAIVLDIYSTSMRSEHLGENDRVNASRLVEELLLNVRGGADECLQSIISIAVDFLNEAQTSHLEIANLDVLINAVLYNPSAALHLMEGHGAGKSRAFFDKWFTAINAEFGLPRVHDKKLSIVAISALLEMDPNAVPPVLQEGWTGIVAGALEIFRTLPKALEARRLLEEVYVEGDDDDDLVDDDGTDLLNMNDEEEDVWDEDSEYLELLAKESARLKEKSERAERASSSDAVDDDASDESEDIPEEDLGYTSPLENVNAYAQFKQALTNFQMHNAQGYQAATASLNVDQQTLLMEVMRIADTPAPAPAT